MTKRSILFLILIITASPLLAQNPRDSVETVFQYPRIHTLGFRISPELQAGNLGGKFSVFYGGSAMITLNRSLSIGVDGFTTGHGFSDRRFNNANSGDLSMHYGGLRLEYTLNPQKKFHLSFPLLVGLGMARNDSSSSVLADPFMGRGSAGQGFGNSRTFAVIQPGINAEINLLPHLNLFAGASYRIVGTAGHDRRNLTTIDSPTLGQLQGFTVSAGLRLRFDFSTKRKNSE